MKTIPKTHCRRKALRRDALDKTARDFLDAAIQDYNQTFHVNFDTSADKFQNYYKDLSQRVKARRSICSLWS